MSISHRLYPDLTQEKEGPSGSPVFRGRRSGVAGESSLPPVVLDCSGLPYVSEVHWSSLSAVGPVGKVLEEIETTVFVVDQKFPKETTHRYQYFLTLFVTNSQCYIRPRHKGGNPRLLSPTPEVRPPLGNRGSFRPFRGSYLDRQDPRPLGLPFGMLGPTTDSTEEVSDKWLELSVDGTSGSSRL